MSDDLIAWLNVQLDEDERRAKWAATVIEGKWDSWEVVAQQLFACCDTVPRVDRVGQHLMHAADPARALREVEAKRAVIAGYRKVASEKQKNTDRFVTMTRLGPGWADEKWAAEMTNVRSHSWERAGQMLAAAHMLRCVALAYADRPGWREEWHPDAPWTPTS